MLLSFYKIVFMQSIKAILSNVTIFCNDKQSGADKSFFYYKYQRCSYDLWGIIGYIKGYNTLKIR